MDLGLESRTYIVTGGTRGLGYAVAQVLVEEGANVLVVSRNDEAVQQAVESLGDRARGLSADLRDAQTPSRAMDEARQSFGSLHGAFVSHGGPPPGPALELDDETLEESLEIATVGPIRLVRDVAKELPEGGAITVLTSWSTVEPVVGLASSNVARPGTWGYLKTLADEVASRGVRVNAVFCGRFTTERQIELLTNMAGRRGTTLEKVRREVEEKIPLGRMGDPKELGRVGAFMLSPAASYVTGAGWIVDGGLVRGL
jgi:3-oxoacyl-[acyl-carrier protein] reductase